MSLNKFFIIKRLKSFVYAFNGLKLFIKEEHNARIHMLAAALAVIFGFIFNINTMEWLVVILSIGLVISMELLNSAIENLADFACAEKNELIKKAKDLGAAAVLWSSFAAFTVGVVIYLPKIWKIIQ